MRVRYFYNNITIIITSKLYYNFNLTIDIIDFKTNNNF